MRIQPSRRGLFWRFFGFLSLVIAIVPYSSLRTVGDWLAPDGTLELFTPQVSLVVKVLFAFGAVLSAGMLLWGRFGAETYAMWVEAQKNAVRTFPRNLMADLRAFCQDFRRFMRLSKAEWLMFLLILVSGIFVRLMLINRPILHDEAYSVVTWGSGSLRYAVSDYHLPNNHVFHTILVNLLYHTFGNTPAMMRLPALLSGVLLISLTFALGKTTVDSNTGLLAAGFCAFAPFLIDYSTNARGYMLLSCCAALVFLLVNYLLHRRNRFGWILFTVSAVVGFYTLPIMLYPFGAVCVWLFLSSLKEDALAGAVTGQDGENSYRKRFHLWISLIQSGLWVILLTFLCYLPIFRIAGFKALFGNVFVQPLPAGDFLPTLFSRLTDWFHAFTDTVPVFLWIAIFCGALLATVFHRQISRIFIPIQAALLLWLIPLWWIQRPNLWPRTQIYLWPFILIWGAAGILFIFDWLMAAVKWDDRLLLKRFVIIGLILMAAVPQVIRAKAIAGEKSLHEQTIQIVAADPAGIEDILLVVAPEDDASLWYYADRYGLPKRLFDRNRPYQIVFVYVNPENAGFEEPRDLNAVVERYGPGMAFLDPVTETRLFEAPNAFLYRFKSNPRVIEKTFGSDRE